MAFHDVQCPTRFSSGSEFGIGFNTRIIQLDSKAEHRIPRGPDAGQRIFTLTRGIDSLDSLRELYTFFLCRGGAQHSFRLKDWFDYATNATGTTHRDDDPAVDYDDQELQLVSGTTYQFVKRYTSGPTTVVRPLRALVSGTVRVGDGTGELLSGFTLDLPNGRVTFDSAPTGTVTGGAQFDCVARFAEETDKALLVAIEEGVTTGSLPEVRALEDVDPAIVSQDYPMGGAYDHGAITASVNVTHLNGKVQRFAPTTTGKKAILPPTTGYPLGGEHFILINDGTQSMEIETSGGTDVVNPFSSGARKRIYLGLSGATPTWFAL